MIRHHDLDNANSRVMNDHTQLMSVNGSEKEKPREVNSKYKMLILVLL